MQAVAQSLAEFSVEAACEGAEEVARAVAARAGSIRNLSDAKDVVKEDVETRIAAVGQLRDKWMASIGESADDMTADVDVVMDVVEKLVCFARPEQQDAPPVDIQSLELSKRTKLEQGFAKYSALGQVGNLWLGHLEHTLFLSTS